MGSISNPGINNLAQILALSGSPLAAAAISSPTGQTSLENAPVGDLVQLSSQAVSLQETAGLLGGGAPSTASNLFYSPTPNLFSSLSTPGSLESLTSSLASPSSLLNSLTAGANAASGSSNNSQQTGANSSSPSEQVAAYVAAIQAQETQALFGSGTQTNEGTSLINMLA